jgi:peptidoglycan/LPS O-acetylase OafA/YrhL
MPTSYAKPAREPVYFPNLNAIRFVAAFLVFLGHLDWAKHNAIGSNQPYSDFTLNNGLLGVNLFFTLSGFLITSLLLKEHDECGIINVRHFYVRRILRIWPLYYFTVLLSFAILPNFISIPSFEPTFDGAHYWSKLVLFLTLLPNVSLVTYPLVSFGSQLWTVGVEEQFYIVWPWITKAFVRNLLPALLAVVLSIVAARVFIHWQLSLHPSYELEITAKLLHNMRFQCMAFGAIGAWLVHSRCHAVLVVIFHKGVQLLVLLTTVMLHACPGSLLRKRPAEVPGVSS